MPSPFTGSAEEQQRFKQHSSPKAFEYYMKEVEKTKNETTRPSPTPMAKSPATLPATTRLAAGSALPEPTRKQLFVSSTQSRTAHEQSNQATNQSNQSINQSINPINQSIQSIQSTNQSNQTTNQSHPPTNHSQPQHSAAELAARAVMQQEMEGMRAMIEAMRNDIEGLECALSEK